MATVQYLKSQNVNNFYLFIYITVMYRSTKFMILNFCTFNIFSILNKGSKNL